jgi:hypothetical protein
LTKYAPFCPRTDDQRIKGVCADVRKHKDRVGVTQGTELELKKV